MRTVAANTMSIRGAGVDGRDDVVLGKWDFPSPKPPPIRVTLDPLWVTARQSKKRRRTLAADI